MRVPRMNSSGPHHQKKDDMESKDQLEQHKLRELQHPQKMYPNEVFSMQKQEPPGSNIVMDPEPDSGEKSYMGHDRLPNRKALITGGDSGIGKAIAIAFSREGAEVAINYLPVEQEDADRLAALFENEGKRLVMIPGDIREEETCRKIVESAHEQLGGLDILVLNAAVQVAHDDITTLTAEQLKNTFEVNVYPLFYFAKYAVPLLPEGASIIITASAEYYTPHKLLLDYAASKSAAVAFSTGLSKQLMDKGIRVNAVCPGPVWTPLEVSGGNPDEGIPVHGLDTPMKRPAQPIEMSGIYVFLASNEATYVSGEVYGLTGGLSAK